MSFNIRSANAADEAHGTGWQVRRDRVLALINGLKPDVLGVQEALYPQMRDLAEGLPSYHGYGCGRNNGQESGEFTSLFYRKERFCHQDESTHWLSPTPQRPSQGWDASLPRTATKLRLIESSTGRSLTVWNTQFDNRGEQARQESARWLACQVRESEEPVIVMGDLNTLPDSACYKMLICDDGLQDAFTASAKPPHGPEGTYRGFRGVPRRGARIDYIFANRDFWVLGYQVPDSYYKELPAPSDHFPVVADLKFR
jgi:endonuclease/exonuclease/phosphatase family metal-dependent hydrolase